MEWNCLLKWIPPSGRKVFLTALSLVVLVPGVVSAQSPSMPGQLDMVPSLERKAQPPQEAFAFQQLDEDDTVSQTRPLQGSITSIKVARGRSQLLKFAQNIMRLSIANPIIADVVALSPDQIMVNGKERGVTSLIVWDENGQEGIFDLYVQNDTSELMDAVGSVAANEKIKARVTDDSFILTGQVSNTVILDEIRKIAAAYGYPDYDDPKEDKFFDLTETPVPQVVLEVKIAEVNRSVGRILRTGFDSIGRDLTLTRLPNAVDSKVLESIGRETSGLIPGQLMRQGGLGSLFNGVASDNAGGITAGFRYGNNFRGMVDFLETSGRINILANPSLVCTHGRVADFLAGGEFPFVSGTDQNGSPLISFKEYGVKLKFTPWISIRSGRIELNVEPEVSSLDTSNCVPGPGGALVCGILKRNTKTTVELADGESLLISGILTHEEFNSFSKTPFVSDLPILGKLFKNADMEKRDRELIVVITPRIVKPSDYGQLLGTAR